MAPVTSSAGQPIRMPLLDGMRTMAALAVMACHVQIFFPDFRNFTRAYLFVDFFFLLSGFILSQVAEPRFRAGLSAKIFLEARWRRLFPAAAFGTIVGMGIFASSNSISVVTLYAILSLLLVPTPFYRLSPYPLNPVLWSLAMELVANAAHVLIFRYLSVKSLIFICVTAGGALIYLIFSLGKNDFPEDAFSWPLALARVAFAYTLGIIIARGHEARMARFKLRNDWIGAAIMPLLAVLALPLLPIGVAAGDSLVTLMILPVAFFWATSVRIPEGVATKLTAAGAISYPLYAVHFPILDVVSRWNDGAVGLTMAIVLSLGLAAMLARVVEQRKVRLPLRGSALA